MKRWHCAWVGLSVVLGTGCLLRPMPETVVQLEGLTIQAQVAQTPRQIRKGLQDRPSLPANSGMLFVFPDAQPRSFWMYRTHVPLDILFFDAQGVFVGAHYQAQPCPQKPCPNLTSPAPARFVLEVAGGLAQAQALEPGKTQLRGALVQRLLQPSSTQIP